MVIKGLKTSDAVIAVGNSHIKKAKISENKLYKLQYLLTKGLYADAITATIAEWTNNAVDSVRKAGKDPVKHPVEVRIKRGKNNEYIFSVEDKGLGLDDEEFEDIVMNYLESTKEEDPEAIGCWGLGSKSFLSLNRSATFTCRKDGVERKYLCYEGAEFMEYNLLYEKETAEENGVRAELVIKDWYERNEFITKAKQKLAYYDTVLLIIDGGTVKNEIFRSEDFQWSTLSSTSYLHFSLKDVMYTINFEQLGIATIYIPICLRFGLSDKIVPTPSREQIIYNEETKQLFKDKIKKVTEWFIEKYNSEIKSYKHLTDAYDKIDAYDKRVIVAGKSFKINDLLDVTGLEVDKPTIDGIILKSPSFYKDHFSDLFYGWAVVKAINHKGNWADKNKSFTIYNSVIHKENKIVIVQNTPCGRYGTFLKETYGNNTLFVKKERERKLWGTINNFYEGYYRLLNLKEVPREKWRSYIQEWQYVVKDVTSSFIEAPAEDSQMYQEWLTAYKQRLKDNRSYTSKTYVGLNKEKAEVTLSIGRKAANFDRITFDKHTEKIENLKRRPRLHVYLTSDELSEETKEWVYKLYEIFPSVQFVQVNKSELKHFTSLHNFVTLKAFYMSKPFARIATALLIDNLLEQIPNSRTEYITEVFPKWKKQYNRLNEYQKEELTGARCSNGLKDIIIEQAKEANNWDFSIYNDYLEFKKIVDMFYFLSLVKEDSYYDTAELKQQRNRLVASLLLFQKKGLDGYELVKKAAPVPELTEQEAF